MNMEKFADIFAKLRWLSCSPSRLLAWPLVTLSMIAMRTECLTVCLCLRTSASQVAYTAGADRLELATAQLPFAASSSSAQQMVVQANAEIYEDDRRSLEVITSLDSALHEDECETVKGLSDDGHSYAGTVVRGILRGDSE